MPLTLGLSFDYTGNYLFATGARSSIALAIAIGEGLPESEGTPINRHYVGNIFLFGYDFRA